MSGKACITLRIDKGETWSEFRMQRLDRDANALAFRIGKWFI